MTPCPSCPRKYRPIPGSGPQPCSTLLIGERPGETENKLQTVFVGKTGEELDNTYLPLASLCRPDVRVCNTVLCWADANRTPSGKDIAGCAAHHLPAEIAITQPSLVILMGASACKLIPSVKLKTHHGIPQHTRNHSSLFGYHGWFVPMYHPSIGLHESKWMVQLLEDWERLPELISNPTGGISFPKPNYRLLTTPSEVSQSFNAIPLSLDRSLSGIDTESHASTPFSVQYSFSPHQSFMVLAKSRQAIECLGQHLRSLPQSVHCLHNSPGDLDLLERLGIRLLRFRDTMQEAFHLGNLPQGLKDLVYCLFQFQMTSWEDVVWPASVDALQEWLMEAHQHADRDLFLTDIKRTVSKVKRIVKIKEIVKQSPVAALLLRLMNHVDSTSEYEPWERLNEFWSEPANSWMTEHITARAGHYPILGIGNAPIDRAVTYACSDADWTRQVALRLESERRKEIWQVPEEDWDR